MQQKSWIIGGLIFGLIIFLCICILYPWFKGNVISKNDLLIGIVLYPASGVFYSYIEMQIKKYFKKEK